MDKSQVASWFLVIVMIGSSLGFASFYLSQQDQQQSLPPEAPPIAETTTLTYTAEGIDGTVAEMMPKAIVTGSTNELDISKIDSQIGTIEGVTNIGSQFRQQQAFQLSSSLTYFAEVQLAKSKNPNEFAAEVKEKASLLQSPEVFLFGLISIPKEITIANKDLNLTKVQGFPDGLAYAYVSAETQKGDSIKMSMEIQLKGESVVATQAFETKNTSGTPISLKSIANLPLTTLHKRLLFTGKLPYYSQFTDDSMKDAIAKLADVNVVDIKFDYDVPRIVMYFNFDSNFDMNAAKGYFIEQLQAIEGVREASFLEEQNAIAFDFNRAYGYAQVKDAALKVFSGSGIQSSQYNLDEPLISVNGDINIFSDVQDAAAKISKLFADAEMKSPLIFQAASFDVNALIDPDTNASYPLPEGRFNALVLPGHNENEQIDVFLNYFVQRGNVVYVQAIEESEKDKLQ